MALQEGFAVVEEHCGAHNLKEMIVMSICVVLCGAGSWVYVANFSSRRYIFLPVYRPLWRFGSQEALL